MAAGWGLPKLNPTVFLVKTVKTMGEKGNEDQEYSLMIESGTIGSNDRVDRSGLRKTTLAPECGIPLLPFVRKILLNR